MNTQSPREYLWGAGTTDPQPTTVDPIALGRGLAFAMSFNLVLAGILLASIVAGAAVFVGAFLVLLGGLWFIRITYVTSPRRKVLP